MWLRSLQLKTYHIDAPMLAMVDLVVPHNGVAGGADLDARQCIAVDVVVFNKASPFPKYVHPTLMAIVYLVFPEHEQN